LADYGTDTEYDYDTTYSLESIEAEFGSLEDYNVDDLLREYGFNDDNE